MTGTAITTTLDRHTSGAPLQRVRQRRQRRQVAAPRRFSASELLNSVYHPLLDLARTRLTAFPGETVHEDTSLLNEAFARTSSGERQFDSSPQFFFAVAQAIDEIRHEENRRRLALLRGGLERRIADEVFESHPGPPSRHEELVMVDEAVMKLRRTNPADARVVVLRYFNGLTAEETAQVLRLSLATVERKWRKLKAWLYKELV